MSKNELYFFKRDKFIVNGVSENKDCKSDRYVASMLKNFEAYGYTCSKELIDLLCTQDVDFLSEWYDSAITLIVRRVGKISVQPMYPNFPKQVMELSRFELYLNAIVHYVTEGHLIPDYQKDERNNVFHIS